MLSVALTYGQLLKVKIENMREQHSEMAGGEAPEEAPAEAEFAPAEKPYARSPSARATAWRSSSASSARTA